MCKANAGKFAGYELKVMSLFLLKQILFKKKKAAAVREVIFHFTIQLAFKL